MSGKALFVCYPRCTTCKKARKWLDGNGIAYDERPIHEDNPTIEELRAWKEASGLPIRRLFNTSGMRYRELKVKDRLDAGMTDEEAFELLSSDGMLVKRPVLVTDGFVSFGFREAEWKEALGV